MATWLKQSTAAEIAIGPFLDSSDGNTVESALTITQPDIRLKKNGGAWAQKSAAQTLTHEENGWYEISLSTTDTDTLGILIVAIHESGALPVWREFNVVPANVYDSFFSTDLLQVDLTQWLGVAPNALTNGWVNSAVLTVIADAIANSSFDVGTGLRSIRSAACTGGAAGSITLDASASSVTDFYKGTRIYLTGGTGMGQSRLCTAYNGTTKVATIEPNWITNPVATTTTFAIRDDAATLLIATGGISSGSFAAGAINAAATNADFLAEVNAEVDTALVDYDGPTFAELDARTDAIEADTQDIQARLPAALVSGRVDASVGAVAANAISDAGVAADMDAYHAKVWVVKESTTADHYAVVFFKNGQPVTSGITSPTIQVIKASDGSDLIASGALTEVASLGIYKKDESTNKLVAGAIYFAKVEATIDSSTRSWLQQIGRDST